MKKIVSIRGMHGDEKDVEQFRVLITLDPVSNCSKLIMRYAKNGYWANRYAGTVFGVLTHDDGNITLDVKDPDDAYCTHAYISLMYRVFEKYCSPTFTDYKVSATDIATTKPANDNALVAKMMKKLAKEAQVSDLANEEYRSLTKYFKQKGIL